MLGSVAAWSPKARATHGGEYHTSRSSAGDGLFAKTALFTDDDLVLQDFGAIARASCASNDLVSRMGGEEFALLIAVADVGAAMAVAERLRNAFADHVTMWNGVAIRATVSIGACHLGHAREDLRQLLLRLDEALYRAKRQGRNRIVWSDGILEAEHVSPRLLKIA